MKFTIRAASLATPALALAWLLVNPPGARAGQDTDSPTIQKLLADAKAEAVQLSRDSDDLQSFTKSKLSWDTYARKLDMIKEHVNASGQLLTKLEEEKQQGSSWQMTAIDKIRPVLAELAANTEATINHLNDNKTKVHFPAFRDYASANFELATQLEALVRDFVAYGDAREKVDTLSRKLEISE